MSARPHPLLVALPAAALLLVLAACGIPAAPGTEAWDDCTLPEDECASHVWLTDGDHDLDSYRLEGELEGIPFAGEVCALNLMPTFWAYRGGDPAAGIDNSLLFAATDQTLESGTVDGGWMFSEFHTVFIYEGTWHRNGAESMTSDGTLTLTLKLGEHLPDPKYVERTITAEFTLTAIPTPQRCTDETDVAALQEEREQLPPIGAWD